MESEILSTLTQYGVLGLWTASLLYTCWQQKKEASQSEQIWLKRHKESEIHNSQEHKAIAKDLTEQNIMLNKAIEKIDAGLRDMRDKAAEDRIRRMKDK